MLQALRLRNLKFKQKFTVINNIDYKFRFQIRRINALTMNTSLMKVITLKFLICFDDLKDQ